MKKRAFALLLVVITVATMFSACKKKPEVHETEFATAYTFNIEGESYAFPTRFARFINAEWSLATTVNGEEISASESLKPGETIMFYMNKGNTNACVVVENDKQEAVTLDGALVTDINFTTAKDSKPVEFEFLDGSINNKTSFNSAKQKFEDAGYTVTTKSSPGDVNDLIVTLAVCQLRLEYAGKTLIQANFYYYD